MAAISMTMGAKHTFSCRRCLSNFSSRYVRFDKTGVLKGFMIFLTATACPVSWSFAELHCRCQTMFIEATLKAIPDKPEGAHSNGLQIRIPMVGVNTRWRLQRRKLAYLLVISKVVPKIWARTNSAMMSDLVPDSRPWSDEGGNAQDGLK